MLDTELDTNRLIASKLKKMQLKIPGLMPGIFNCIFFLLPFVPSAQGAFKPSIPTGAQNWELVQILPSDSSLKGFRKVGLLVSEIYGSSPKSKEKVLQALKIETAMLGGNRLYIPEMDVNRSEIIVTQIETTSSAMIYGYAYSDYVAPQQQFVGKKYEVTAVYEFILTKNPREAPELKEHLPETITIVNQKYSTEGVLQLSIRSQQIPELIPYYNVIYADESKLILSTIAKRPGRSVLYNIVLRKP